MVPVEDSVDRRMNKFNKTERVAEKGNIKMVK